MNSSVATSAVVDEREKLEVLGSMPFFVMHAICLLAFFTPFHARDVVIALALYYVRMIAVTMGYHRYFSHRTFKTSRVFQFVLAVVASSSAQKGVLWWAANHRHHHRESDQPDDVHSPIQKGFWWSHVGWILSSKHSETRFDGIRDFARYPELRWLNRFHLLPPIALGVACFFIGGWELLLWGFFISTVVLWHGTFTINSLSHVFGKRRYKTTDTSRNNWALAVITCGEGWHNNHHYHQNTANQGWFWWEIDLTYYVLRLFSMLGLVWDLRLPGDSVKLAHLKYSDEDRAQLRREPVLASVMAAGDRMRDALADTLAASAPAPMLKRQ